MTSPHTDLSTLDSTLLAAKSGRRRKRFLAISVAALAVLSVAMGVSFLGNTGTTKVGVTASSSAFVFPVGEHGIEGSVPPAVTELAHGSTAASGTKVSNLPSWSPIANSAGEVKEGGDLVLIDATGTGLVANLYVTNLAGMQAAYTSFALPVVVWQSACTEENEAKTECTKIGTWSKDPEVSSTFLTNTEGNLSFSLKNGMYYDVTIEQGGSYYAVSTENEDDMSPSFYFTAQPV